MSEMNERKIMYHMIMSIEYDFIDFLYPDMKMEDFTEEMNEKIYKRCKNANSIRQMLEQLGLGDFVEITNKCKYKLDITQSELEFINQNCSGNIVEIRNRVMHPKPLCFSDYAILENLFYKITEYVHSIPWINVKKSQIELKENPEAILKLDLLECKNSIIDNLPELDCEEIEFVGRRKEIGELKKLLMNDKIRVISIVAAGGYGKTALALKVLNELKDSGKSPYELIVWISFKTRQLDKTSFIDIKDAVVDIASMNNSIQEFVGGTDMDPQQELIELAKQFKTLLVLDNLETINHKDTFPFIEEFFNYGKVLITSRVSLGELEKRYDLLPLNSNDMLEFTNSLLSYYNLDQNFTNSQVSDFAERILFSNPLSIKWAIRSMSQGADIETIIKDRENVVDFCMSNVFDKITPLGKNILYLLAFNDASMTLGQIVYYLQKDVDDLVDIHQAIVQLNKACFIDKLKMKQGNYSLIEQAKIFINSRTDRDGLKQFFTNKKREINTIHQEINILSEQDPFNLYTVNIFENNEDIIISAYYLFKAVSAINERKNTEALDLINLAENISPDYSECYKFHGLVLSYLDKTEAEDMYLTAIKKSKNDREKVLQLFSLTNYYIRVNRYVDAVDTIDKALNIDSQNSFLILEKIRTLLFVGKYSLAENIINKINVTDLATQKEKNIYVTRKADLMRRKAEQLDELSQVVQRQELLISAFDLLLEQENPDDYLSSMLCRIAGEIVFLQNFKSCAEHILNPIFQRIEQLYKLKTFIEFKNKLRRFLDVLNENLLKRCLELFYGIDPSDYTDNIGQVSNVKDNYGFIVNFKYPQGIYFTNINGLKKGDKVTFNVVKKYNKIRAVDVKIIEEE